jgi:hypothetical protein
MEINSYVKTIISFLKLLLWSFIWTVLVILIYNTVVKFYPDFFQPYKEISTNARRDDPNRSIWNIILYACLLAPIIEECVFRLNISKNIKHHYFSICIGILYFIYCVIIGSFLNGSIFLIYTLITFSLFYFFKNKISLTYLLIQSSLVFGLIHINNLDHENVWNIISYIIYVLPLSIMGFYLGKIRIKHGIIFAIFGHFIKNTIAIYSLYG